ncbi:DUF3102 family protein [Ochrobactrum sp. BH3]|nr:DUF3102 family protein [Ochrobactrum sp. BH3]
MNRVNEIKVEGVGIVRHLTDDDCYKLRKAARGPNKHVMPYALACGLSIQRFKALSDDQKRDVARAYHYLCSSDNIIPIKRPDVETTVFQPRIHRTDEQMIEIGRYLVEMKQSLPHGEFGPWVRDKSGLSKHTVAKAMKLATGA